VGVRLVQPESEVWESLLTDCGAPLMASALWTRVLCRGLAAAPAHAVWEEGGRAVCGLPGILIRRGVFAVLYASLPYAMPVGDPRGLPHLLRALAEWATRASADQLRLSLWTEIPEVSGARAEPLASTVLSLEPRMDGDPLAAYPKYVRRDVRKAEREGVAVRSGRGPDAARTISRLYSAAMRRNAAAVRYPEAYFLALQADVVDAGHGVTLIAESAGRPVAAVVCVHSGATAHFLHGGSEPAFLKHCPNDALVHAAIQWSRDRGARVFDFGYSSPADTTLIRFKEKWGGTTARAHTWILDAAPLKCAVMEIARRLALSRPANAVRQWFQS
jgi:hypothetical protein